MIDPRRARAGDRTDARCERPARARLTSEPKEDRPRRLPDDAPHSSSSTTTVACARCRLLSRQAWLSRHRRGDRAEARSFARKTGVRDHRARRDDAGRERGRFCATLRETSDIPILMLTARGDRRSRAGSGGRRRRLSRQALRSRRSCCSESAPCRRPHLLSRLEQAPRRPQETLTELNMSRIDLALLNVPLMRYD